MTKFAQRDLKLANLLAGGASRQYGPSVGLGSRKLDPLQPRKDRLGLGGKLPPLNEASLRH